MGGGKRLLNPPCVTETSPRRGFFTPDERATSPAYDTQSCRFFPRPSYIDAGPEGWSHAYASTGWPNGVSAPAVERTQSVVYRYADPGRPDQRINLPDSNSRFRPRWSGGRDNERILLSFPHVLPRRKTSVRPDLKTDSRSGASPPPECRRDKTSGSFSTAAATGQSRYQLRGV